MTDQHDQSFAERFLRLDTPAISDAQSGLGVVGPGFRCLVPGSKIAGPAYTVRAYPGSFMSVMKALAEAPAGEVLVVDAGGDVSAGALWGEIVADEARQRGIRGIIIDGAARDTNGLREVGFPTWAAGVTPRLGTNLQVGPTQVPISCGGIALHPGDWIFADDDGVVVIPTQRAELVLKAAEAIERRDREVARRVGMGERLVDLLDWHHHINAQQQAISVMNSSDTQLLRIGFIGLGLLGEPMALRLLQAGHQLVVHNRSREVINRLVRLGATAAHSPREVAEQVEIVCTALPGPADVEDVYLGDNGVLLGAREGLICVDHSTVGPDVSRRIAAALRTRGATVLDAPVSGGAEGAAAGSLVIMVGGPREAFEQVRPVLETVGRRVEYCGESGAGATMKLLNQVLVAIHSVGAAELVALSKRLGVDRQQVLEVVLSGLGSSAILARNGPRMLNEDLAPGAKLELVVKDAALVRELCEKAGIELPLFLRAKQTYEEALDQGLDGYDLAAVVQAIGLQGGAAAELADLEQANQAAASPLNLNPDSDQG